MIPAVVLAALLVTATAQAQTSSPSTIRPGDRVVVTADAQPIAGRIADVTSDELTLEGPAGPKRMTFATIQRIDRVGDSLLNGSVIGGAVGGGLTLALVGKLCANTGCADTSASLDPRLTLLGTLIGAGVGAIVDAAIDGRKTIYTSGGPKPLLPQAAAQGRAPRTGVSAYAPILFGRFGWARLTDDEGSLGDGASVGVGAIVPVTPRLGLAVAYDRHRHRRDLEPPGPGASIRGGFTGTEQLVTAKALFYFRRDESVRPYAGIGVSFLDSERVSEFPTYVLQGGSFPVPGPPEIFRYHTRGGGLGFATGLDVRIADHLYGIGDLTLDLNNPDALGSTRLTVGAGWRF